MVTGNDTESLTEIAKDQMLAATRIDIYEENLKRFSDIHRYECPVCDYRIGTLIPPIGEIFTSLVICPQCTAQHFKEVDHGGNVQTELIKE